MRLISADSYSFGQVPFAWSGLLDPKLFQRYTWLLPPSLFSPVVIPTIGVSTGRANVNVSSPEYDISALRPRRGVDVGEPVFGVCIKKGSTSVST
jgi:hypothetical protein